MMAPDGAQFLRDDVKIKISDFRDDVRIKIPG